MICSRSRDARAFPVHGARGCVTGALVRRSPEHARCGSQRVVVTVHPLARPIPRSGILHPLRRREKRGVAPRPDPLDYISSLSSRRATFSFWPAIESTRSPFPVVIAHHSPEGSLGIPPVVGSRLPSVPSHVTSRSSSFSEIGERDRQHYTRGQECCTRLAPARNHRSSQSKGFSDSV